MTLNRRIALGLTLGVDPLGGTVYQTLASIVDGIKEGGSKADIVDISILSDTFKQKAKGQIDPNDVTLTIAYDPDDTTSNTIKTLHDSTALVPPSWLITMPAGTLGTGTAITSTKTFKGFVTGVAREMVKDKMLTAEITITKTSGPDM